SRACEINRPPLTGMVHGASIKNSLGARCHAATRLRRPVIWSASRAASSPTPDKNEETILDNHCRPIKYMPGTSVMPCQVLAGIGAWSQTTNGRVDAATPVGTDLLHMMENAKGLSQTQFVDYSLVFN